MRLFLHGLQSSDQGTKAVYFRSRFPGMLTPHLEGDLETRLTQLRELVGGREGIRLVGSSFGGLMATLFTLERPLAVKRLILLAPALNHYPFRPHGPTIPIPVTVFHGREDDVIPIAAVEPISRRLFADLSFQPLTDDHFLHRNFKGLDWGSLLA